eukprot:4018-Eustigmatos_ZCMA.PRE.1
MYDRRAIKGGSSLSHDQQATTNVFTSAHASTAQDDGEEAPSRFSCGADGGDSNNVRRRVLVSYRQGKGDDS